MLARLNNAFDVQKQFSANAAHELRTPLAVMQTNLDIFQKERTFRFRIPDTFFHDS
ncbi:MAG: histidine kinase dimerization/phospho-acceptor domain-containing protein [Lachnospiraceae bacterium]